MLKRGQLQTLAEAAAVFQRISPFGAPPQSACAPPQGAGAPSPNANVCARRRRVSQARRLSRSPVQCFDRESMIRAAQEVALDDEVGYGPSLGGLAGSPQIRGEMRCKLVNWMVEVALHFHLHRETLHLAVYYVDRLLTVERNVKRADFQLVGVAALFIAAKLEEIYPPKLKAFSELCDGVCSTRDIFHMELRILTVRPLPRGLPVVQHQACPRPLTRSAQRIGWRLNFRTVYFWLGSYLELLRPYLRDDVIEAVRASALELVDLAMHVPRFMATPYSVIAASALYIRLEDGREAQPATRTWCLVSGPTCLPTPPLLFSTHPHADRLFRHATEASMRILEPCIGWLEDLFTCPESIVYFSPDEPASEADFDEAILTNCRIMEHLMVSAARPSILPAGALTHRLHGPRARLGPHQGAPRRLVGALGYASGRPPCRSNKERCAIVEAHSRLFMRHGAPAMTPRPKASTKGFYQRLLPKAHTKGSHQRLTGSKQGAPSAAAALRKWQQGGKR